MLTSPPPPPFCHFYFYKSPPTQVTVLEGERWTSMTGGAFCFVASNDLILFSFLETWNWIEWFFFLHSGTRSRASLSIWSSHRSLTAPKLRCWKESTSMSSLIGDSRWQRCRKERMRLSPLTPTIRVLANAGRLQLQLIRNEVWDKAGHFKVLLPLSLSLPVVMYTSITRVPSPRRSSSRLPLLRPVVVVSPEIH